MDDALTTIRRTFKELTAVRRLEVATHNAMPAAAVALQMQIDAFLFWGRSIAPG
jgi:hypothetical protein